MIYFHNEPYSRNDNIYSNMCTNIYMHTHLHKYKHLHMHTYICTYTYTPIYTKLERRVIRPEKVISRALKCETDFRRQTDGQ
jgi:hypothetical protein